MRIITSLSTSNELQVTARETALGEEIMKDPWVVSLVTTLVTVGTLHATIGLDSYIRLKPLNWFRKLSVQTSTEQMRNL
jgi:hypothetical protein